METRITLRLYGGSQLWTRETARKVRADVVKILDELQGGDTLVIDTKGVEVFDYSFANELFGKTILSLAQEYPGRFLLVENLTRYTKENLVKALEGLGLMIIERKEGKLTLLGKVHPSDQATFSAILPGKGAVTAAELRDKLKLNLNAMNERLSKLAGFGLVRREKGASLAGREQYEYRVLG